MKEFSPASIVIPNLIRKLSYLLIMISLIAALIAFDSVISGENSVAQSNLFVHRYLDYFQYIQHTFKNGFQLDPLINSLNGVSNWLDLSSQNFITSILVFIGAIFSIVFIYLTMRKGFIENLELVHPNFPNEMTYTILMTLVFSVGVAFYFSSTFIETSGKEIITQMISEMTTQNLGLKLALIQIQLQENAAAYNAAVIHETYFFVIFSFLAVGVVIRQKTSFFSKAFFNASIVAILYWIFYYSRMVIAA